jgi:thiamine pyrophosphate-dependent acetolactate synthase large subunit-like protein
MDPARAAELLAAAKSPLMMVGRVAGGAVGSEESWRARIALAEKLGMRVLTDIKAPAGFPTDHPLHAAPPSTFNTPEMSEAIKNADAILSLDWIDLAGTLRTAFGGDAIPAKVIQASVDQHVHHGWSKDHMGLPPADLYFLNEPDLVVRALLAELAKKPGAARPVPAAKAPQPAPAEGPIIDVAMVAQRLRAIARRSRGAGRCGISAGRRITSASTAAPASARGPAWPWAQRSPCAAAGDCRSRSWATATI